jgi:CHASE2 domain-containing sensor protein
MGIPSLENLAASDLSLNDLYYQQRNPPALSNEIILVNSGSLSSTQFRSELSQVIKQIDSYQPKVIAIDHIFDSDSSKLGTNVLFRTFQETKNLIVPAYSKDFEFPSEQHTIRRYFWGENTLAYQVALKIDSTVNNHKKWSESFLLKYYSTNYEPPSLPMGWQNSFVMIEASDLLDPDNQFLKDYIENKAIMVGLLGNSCIPHHFDLEDKFPVPPDIELVNRQRTTPGLIIHANAVENLINPDQMFFNIHDSIWFTLIEELILLLYLSFLIFVRAGKVLNVIILLALSLPAIFLVILLMEKNLYIEIGATLIQFLLFEELVEVIESVKEKGRKMWINLKK